MGYATLADMIAAARSGTFKGFNGSTNVPFSQTYKPPMPTPSAASSTATAKPTAVKPVAPTTASVPSPPVNTGTTKLYHANGSSVDVPNNRPDVLNDYMKSGWSQTPIVKSATQQVANPVAPTPVAPAPPMPTYNVNDPTFLNMSSEARLAAFKADPNLARQEVLRDKSVYNADKAAGDMAGATGAHNWADQVRGVAGIPNTDLTYGNAPDRGQTNNNGLPGPSVPMPGSIVQPQKAPGSPVAPAAPTTPMPQSTPTQPYGQLTPAQIQAEAQARIDQQRAALEQSVNATKAGLKNTYDYNNQLLHDSRVLEDEQFKRQNSPFTGQTDYLTAQLLRNRGIQDTAAQKDYAANVAAADQKLADFNSMAPEQQQSIVDQLTQLERQYGLQAGQLTGIFNGAPTLAAQGQAAQYTGLYNGQPTLQAQNQQFQQGIQTAGLTGLYNGQPTLQAQNQQFNQNMAQQQFAYQQARDAIKDKQYQQQFDENVKQFGLNYALQQAQLANQITNDQAQRAISQQNADTAQTNATNSKNSQHINDLLAAWKASGIAPAGLESLGIHQGEAYTQTNQPKPQTAADVSKLIDESPSMVENINGFKKVVDPKAVESFILSSGLPESEMVKLYQMYGISLK